MFSTLSRCIPWRCPNCRQWFLPWRDTMAREANGMCCFCGSWRRPQAARRVPGVAMRTFDNAPGEQSPYVVSMSDYQQNAITVTFNYSVASRAFTTPACVVTRDVGCVYAHLYIGLGADGTPNTTLKQFAVPVGSTTVTAGQLAANGVNTIDDVRSYQITAGP